MASSKEYLDYILDQLSSLNEISYKKMMGEYIIYYKDKLIGGIYDNRFLVKPTKSAEKLMENPKYEFPYEGGKEMLLVENVDDRAFLEGLITKLYEELPFPKSRKGECHF